MHVDFLAVELTDQFQGMKVEFSIYSFNHFFAEMPTKVPNLEIGMHNHLKLNRDKVYYENYPIRTANSPLFQVFKIQDWVSF